MENSRTSGIKAGIRPTVLIVEDDKDSKDFMIFLLSKDFNLLFAESAEESWKVLLENQVSLVSLDLSIYGEVDGLELARKIRSHESMKYVPIIAVTAHAFPQDERNSLEAGCDYYVSKPFNPKKLRKLMWDCIEQYQKIRDSETESTGQVE